MGVERIILWRHGETDANRSLRIQGSIDIPLNERGRAQARASASSLRSSILQKFMHHRWGVLSKQQGS